MANTEEVLKVLRRYGKEVHPYTSKRTPGLYTAVCPGCGKEISSDDNLNDIEYAVTKRSTATFFHTGCVKHVWDRGIR